MTSANPRPGDLVRLRVCQPDGEYLLVPDAYGIFLGVFNHEDLQSVRSDIKAANYDVVLIGGTICTFDTFWEMQFDVVSPASEDL